MLPSLRGLFAYFSGWLSNRGIQLRSGTRQEFRFPSFSKVLTTSATKLATKFEQELSIENWLLNSGRKRLAGIQLRRREIQAAADCSHQPRFFEVNTAIGSNS